MTVMAQRSHDKQLFVWVLREHDDNVELVFLYNKYNEEQLIQLDAKGAGTLTESAKLRCSTN